MTAFTSGAAPVSCLIVPAPKRLCSILWPARSSETGEGVKSGLGATGLDDGMPDGLGAGLARGLGPGFGRSAGRDGIPDGLRFS